MHRQVRTTFERNSTGQNTLRMMDNVVLVLQDQVAHERRPSESSSSDTQCKTESPFPDQQTHHPPTSTTVLVPFASPFPVFQPRIQPSSRKEQLTLHPSLSKAFHRTPRQTALLSCSHRVPQRRRNIRGTVPPISKKVYKSSSSPSVFPIMAWE